MVTRRRTVDSKADQIPLIDRNHRVGKATTSAIEGPVCPAPAARRDEEAADGM
jgi:hypothetical protein